MAAGLTQETLAERLAVSLRTVGNWERSRVPRGRAGAVRAILGDQLDTGGGPTLAASSDLELVAEIAKRLSRAAGVPALRVVEVEASPGGLAYERREPQERDMAARRETGESPPDDDA
jgi:transcriptional regulator with XRE-family HTH domain